MKRIYLFVILTIISLNLIACGSSKKVDTKTETSIIKNKSKIYKKGVIASYYHDKFNGKKTASGEIFNNKKQTAAHRKLPFGTTLKVINRTNGKWVLVKVNDRGPFTKGKEIDLSKKAWLDITDDPKKGNLKVDIEIVE